MRMLRLRGTEHRDRYDSQTGAEISKNERVSHTFSTARDAAS